MAGESFEMTGIVVEAHRGDQYTVECRMGAMRRTVLARRSGRLVLHRIRILPGDEVTVEVGVYDTTRGRITYRGRRQEAAQ